MPKRTRFSPHERREQIKAAVSKLVLTHGRHFTMADVAVFAKMSPRLVRHYYTMRQIRKMIEVAE